jgi:4-hydroxybenzoate polyprenyltransferase
MNRPSFDIVAAPGRAAAFLRTMRPKHWAKNLLVFVPLLTAHEYESAEAVLAAVIAFVCFGLCASGGYFINDLKDIESDQQHEIKRSRPLASGALPVSWGVAGAFALPAAALALAWFYLSPAFIAALALYFVLTLSYSLALKRIFTADVLTLSILYMLRVLAGAVAIEVELSAWLLAFCIFLFISLAYLKRYSELRKMNGSDNKVLGRGYVGADSEAMYMLGIANATASIVVFALFINSPEVQREYASRDVLWIICLVLIFWTNRVWITARRGGVDEDPVEFALKDPASRAAGAICVLVMLTARYFDLPI